MNALNKKLLSEIRHKFAFVDECPFQGERIFFENAGGALTLNSAVETSTKFAAIPDNQGRENIASKALQDIITKSKQDAKAFLGVHGEDENNGNIIIGESGTELIFRIISAAILSLKNNETVIGSTLEHPATRSACQKWADINGNRYHQAKFNLQTGSIDASDYESIITDQTKVATIIHTSPVTGMGVDIAAVSKSIRKISPECFIIVDGIQHAAHGGIHIDSYDIDAYIISPYKVFSRHGYGLAWISDRLASVSHNQLNGAPLLSWDLGTRDTGACATFSDVVDYFEWLGAQTGEHKNRYERFENAAQFIKKQEDALVKAMIYGTGNQKGLADYDELEILFGQDNPKREGLIALHPKNMTSSKFVDALNKRGIRTHTRKADHYSGNILTPLKLDSCVRISMCHYNTEDEVAACLTAIHEIMSGGSKTD